MLLTVDIGNTNITLGVFEGKKLHVKKKIMAQDAIRKYSKDFNGALSDKDVLKIIGIARNTYYKYKKELR